ncbi:MAG: phenol hydroxylase subunit P4 [Thauera sp.]|nr:phenol hydroxylase subunit P4 [Thauera sp.]
MPVIAKAPGYKGDVRDRVENYRGKQLLYVGWDDHMMFPAPIALAVRPEMSFGEFVNEVLPATAYPAHPDWARIDWSRVEWLRSGERFTPDADKSLADNGIGHKAVIRLRTPGLEGLRGTRN